MQTLDHLEDNIRCVIADIRPQMLKKVIENSTSRLDYIRASRGSPMPEIIFKILHAEIVEVEIEVVSPSIVPSGNFAELNRTFTCAIGPDFIFMDDNVRTHLTLAVNELLESEDITRMDWPAYSSDLNPIEHV
ncbi:hypothetical protein TNCV_290851 [Trichonephila clavipes]|nr:hypothetical protein TNCV_290851 [Trichonephila clavipes]